ncbi:undecaprenyl-phosphate glucose phosphotransferase [Psychroserpens luteus]|uniref:Undecaprenyl-phosphate glucose phosphotransferase n=1 Tax=Psychroserpens luteus TaxID=1434066 RepID=A0ABW5ZWV5_9FLAO|nr:undecaprenyl-phosphate glucose phosphotransferase [Psychroserpens luteus]
MDLFIILAVSYTLLSNSLLDLFFFGLFWICLSFFFSFYKVYRFTTIIRIISLLSKQISVFTLLIFTYYYIKGAFIDFKVIFLFYVLLLIIFNLWRIVLHSLFRKYRVVIGGDYNRVVILGKNSSTKRLELFFNNEPSYGYKYSGFFTDKNENNKLGSISESFDYVLEKNIDEIYCSIKELTNDQITKLIFFADNNLKTLKFIPDNKYIFSKKLKFENYNIIPILSLSEIPLKTGINKFTKRAFDIIFSLLVIIGILSWFTPLIALLIRLESKGPVFFKQLRYGADFNLFACYKFRSMMANKDSDSVQAAKNDMRITKMGKFIRRTSIDELPQFFNVLFGSMSVVGPRPLLLSHTNDYKNKINKFMVRHTVKPGITGLAQVSGYRGNIETDMDMQNRVKYDIFYVENWSWTLDFKIIIKTISNVLKGEEKAY